MPTWVQSIHRRPTKDMAEPSTVTQFNAAFGKRYGRAKKEKSSHIGEQSKKARQMLIAVKVDQDQA